MRRSFNFGLTKFKPLQATLTLNISLNFQLDCRCLSQKVTMPEPSKTARDSTQRVQTEPRDLLVRARLVIIPASCPSLTAAYPIISNWWCTFSKTDDANRGAAPSTKYLIKKILFLRSQCIILNFRSPTTDQQPPHFLSLISRSVEKDRLLCWLRTIYDRSLLELENGFSKELTVLPISFLGVGRLAHNMLSAVNICTHSQKSIWFANKHLIQAWRLW